MALSSRWRSARIAGIVMAVAGMVLGGAGATLGWVELSELGIDWQAPRWVPLALGALALVLLSIGIFILLCLPGKPLASASVKPGEWFSLQLGGVGARRLWLSWKYRSPVPLAHGEYGMALRFETATGGPSAHIDALAGWRSGVRQNEWLLNSSVSRQNLRVLELSASFMSGGGGGVNISPRYVVAFHFDDRGSAATARLADVRWPARTLVRGRLQAPALTGELDAVVFVT